MSQNLIADKSSGVRRGGNFSVVAFFALTEIINDIEIHEGYRNIV